MKTEGKSMLLQIYNDNKSKTTWETTINDDQSGFIQVDEQDWIWMDPSPGPGNAADLWQSYSTAAWSPTLSLSQFTKQQAYPVLCPDARFLWYFNPWIGWYHCLDATEQQWEDSCFEIFKTLWQLEADRVLNFAGCLLSLCKIIRKGRNTCPSSEPLSFIGPRGY